MAKAAAGRGRTVSRFAPGLTSASGQHGPATKRDDERRLEQSRERPQPGDLEIPIVMYADYGVTYLSHAVADLPVVLVGRWRSAGHASAGGFATSARRRHARRPHRNSRSQARDGRPARRNKHRAKRHDLGKTVKRTESIKKHRARRG